ncbi:hypothetical protein BOX15_Mlig006119g1 [Macrostomum lignano]|uniref:SEC7 domain-containing protein n=1 Tax=Macrostomum lignano TaxID=282301 RepID=A0A267GR98_9PLAT|nr:hypothetical protein BOX15_Mlig006119g1 [Macrostomum lignano]
MTQAEQSSANAATIEELLNADGNGLAFMDEASKPDIIVTGPDPVDNEESEDEDQLVSVSRQPSIVDCNGGSGSGNELEPEDPRTPPDGQEDSSSDSESLAESIYHQPPKAADREAARRLAKRLFLLEGFRHTDVAKHLSRKNDFNTLVGEEYAALFDFSDDTLDTALRKFLSRFCLQGETADQERVLLHFAKSYLRCNPDSYPTADSCHTLACALLLLNKDLHGAIGQRMTSQQFIDNLANLNEGQNYPREVLKSLYQAIKSQPILQPAGLGPIDSAEAAAGSAAAAAAATVKSTTCAPPGQPGVSDGQSGSAGAAGDTAGLSNPGLATGDGNGGGGGSNGPGIEFRKGFLVRKHILDSGGRRTRKGRRSWRRVYCVLKDLSLAMHKDDSVAAVAAASPDAELRVHHSLAGPAPEYTKRRHVWRLRLASGAELLLQAASQADADAWVEAVNRAAAWLSAQALPAPVGSQPACAFARPLLPSGPSNLPIAEQLVRFREQVASVKSELQSLGASSGDAPSDTSPAAQPTATPATAAASPVVCPVGGAERQRHVAFLQHELVRYRAYMQLLEAEIASAAPTPAVASTVAPASQPGELADAISAAATSNPSPTAPAPTESEKNGPVELYEIV